ncbi:Fructose-2,6-bisphosphatase [Actinomortierella ambigua]|nr:Fructose-2,6-bisphosphatase [Actinomortierella ambigua]
MWLGIQTKVFNVGNYRRKLHGAQQPHDFFDPANVAGERSRKEAAVEALNDMISWFENERGVVALYDATNSTRARREMLLAACAEHDIQVLFIESICQDESLILHNIMDVKLSSPDYKDMDPEKAAEDFRARIVHYEEAYETITEDHLTFIKLINVGSQVIISHIQGYLQSRIVYYLMNLHIAPRNIFFSRHGESLYNVMGKLGGDSELSARGKQYARALPLLISTHLGGTEQLTVWTSTLKRTIATAEQLPYPKLQWKALDELDAGVCDGMTYEEIEEQYPEDFANRDDDKFNYRYRGGESYRDVVVRLEPVIMELERHHNILIVGHQAILRCIYAYFMNYSHEKLPYIKIPLHTLIQLTPRAYMCEEKRYKVDIEAVDTHRPKPKRSKDSATSTTGSALSSSSNGSAPSGSGSGTGGAPKTTPEKIIAPPSTIVTSNPQDGGETTTASIITTCMSTTTFRDDLIKPRSKRSSLNNPATSASAVSSNGLAMTPLSDDTTTTAAKAKEIQTVLQEVEVASSSSSSSATQQPLAPNVEAVETLTQSSAAPTMNGTSPNGAISSNGSLVAESITAPATSAVPEPPATIATSSVASSSSPRASSPSSSRTPGTSSSKMAGVSATRPAGVSTRSNSISSTGSHQTAVETSSSSYSQPADSRTSTAAVANGGFRYRPMEDLATPPMSPVPDNFYRSLLNRTASTEGVNSAAAAAVAASVGGLSTSSSSPGVGGGAGHGYHHHQSLSAMMAMPPPPSLSLSTHGSPSANAVGVDVDAMDTTGHSAVEAAGELPSSSSSSSSSSPSGSNLSIRTQGLLTTPPALMRLKSEAWQEGLEYERTAGASPRDPLVSPGGRLLPQQDNWHFP